jgi:hypothetical protein
MIDSIVVEVPPFEFDFLYNCLLWNIQGGLCEPPSDFQAVLLVVEVE